MVAPLVTAVAAPIISGLIGKAFGLGGEDPQQAPAPQGYVSPNLGSYDQWLMNALTQMSLQQRPDFWMNGQKVEPGKLQSRPTDALSKYGQSLNMPQVGDTSDPMQAILKQMQGFSPQQLQGQMGAIDKRLTEADQRALGYSNEEMEAMKENLRQEIGRASEQSMKGINASLASRGMRGGAMTGAQLQNARNVGQTTEEGMRNILLGGADARLKDRSTRDTMIGNLLGLRGTAAQGISDAMLKNLENQGGLATDVSKLGFDVQKANQNAAYNQFQANTAQQAPLIQSELNNQNANIGDWNALAQGGAEWNNKQQQALIDSLMKAFSTMQGGAAQSYAAGNDAYSNYLKGQGQQNDLMSGISQGILQLMSPQNKATSTPTLQSSNWRQRNYATKPGVSPTR